MEVKKSGSKEVKKYENKVVIRELKKQQKRWSIGGGGGIKLNSTLLHNISPSNATFSPLNRK